MLCVLCKGGRNLCGKGFCPLMTRLQISKRASSNISKDIFGPSPGSVFVGRHGYPDVNVGPMVCMEGDPSLSDSPSKWYGMGIESIMEMRAGLVRSKSVKSVFRPDGITEFQEIALAKRPTDIEISFSKKPSMNFRFSDTSQPVGPSGDIERFRLAENPKIPRLLEKLVNDELKAVESCGTLYKRGYDVSKLSGILSSGALGIKKRMVPTRWSITAVDDMMGKKLIKEILDLPSVNGYLIYSNEYLDNHFEILLIPGAWEFEQFESWFPGTLWTSGEKTWKITEDHEPFSGRKRYAEEQGGGYYASRLAVLEGLKGIRRQARAIVFREIGEGYVIPVGVWEVRENVRNAFRSRPSKFATLGEALKEISSRLRVPFAEYKAKSRILQQKRLCDF